MTPGSALLLLDGPYVSDYLRDTVQAHGLPVYCTSPAVDPAGLGARQLDEASAAALLARGARVLTNSENALGWLAGRPEATSLAASAQVFKDKARTRDLLRGLYPDFRYREFPLADLPHWEPAGLPYPFVVKPAVGFFSLGVHLVSDHAAWEQVRARLDHDLRRAAGYYPCQVLDPGRLLAEECIFGEEYAVDAWYDGDGQAVVTNILIHKFGSALDVSDRVYSTSVAIIRRWLQPFTAWLNEVGALAGLRRFPVHAEVRVRPDGRIVPIEINPLRFGGWCTTADLAAHAWGFNPYLSFLSDERPDWQGICATRDDRLWSIVVLDNSTGVPGDRITGFDYEAVCARFANVLECRPVDPLRYPLFGFILVETPADRAAELAEILVSDLREFLT